MPEPLLPYMLLPTPTPGSDTGIWAPILNAATALIDGHDHTTNKGKPVPSAGINIDAALDFHSFRAINMAGVNLGNLSGLLASGTNEFFGFGGDAYWRSGGGVNVKVTNGGALNMTTVGGIAGDYTTAGAEVAYVNAGDNYTFKQEVGAGVRQYAKLDSADVRMHEYKAAPAAGVPTNFVALRSPAALAASYVVTMPAALPGSALLQQVDAAGLTTWSNTVTGLLTANAGISVAANQNIDLAAAGTGRVTRAFASWSTSPVGGQASGGTVAFDVALGNLYLASTGAGTWTQCIALPDHFKVTQLDIEVFGNAACNIVFDAARVDGAGVTGVASNNVTPPAAYSLLTINNAALAAAWTVLGQTFTSAVLIVKFTFGAAGGRIRRIIVSGNEA